MPPNPTVNSTLRNLALAGLLLCALLGFAWWKCNISTVGLSCRVCAAERDHKTIYFYNHRLGSWDTEARASGATLNYFDRHLGYPHAHQWGYRASWDDLTVIGLQLVAVSGIREPERRRKFFEDITQPTDDDHFFRVIHTHQAIKRAIYKNAAAGYEPGTDYDPVWGPDMEGVRIPDEVKGGMLLPDADAPQPRDNR